MEQCLICAKDTVVVMMLDDGVRIPVCNEHLPNGEDEAAEGHDRFFSALGELYYW